LFSRGFRWEENPLVEGCTCYTCINYSRSYIYHLYEVKEMNATILTALHNMKAYDDMFNFFGTKLDLPNRVAWFIL
jgi:tRNA-guanine family transglycosylase